MSDTGIKAYRKIQMGVESTPGTLVDATTVWRGVGTIQNNLDTVFPVEDVGILPGTDRSYIPRVEALLNLESIEATFEQLPLLFNAGIYKVAPTTDSVSTWTWPIASTDAKASTDLGTLSVRGGDNKAVESFTYGFARTINLTGEGGQAVMVNSEIQGREVEPGAAYTAAIAIPSVEDILFSKGKLYIDNVGTGFGTTQKSNTFLDMNLAITTGWTPVWTGDGNIYFSFVKQVMPEILLTITFEHDDTAVAEKALWIAGTARKIRVQFDGSGTKYARFDLAGKYDNWQAIGERDGNDIVQATFRARYNAADAVFAEFAVKTV